MSPIQSASSLNSLSSILMAGRSTMNSIRLTQALNGKSTAVTAVAPVQNSLSSGSEQFLTGYRGKMTDMLTKAAQVLNPAAGDKLAAGSEDNSVAAVSGAMANKSDRYDLVVEQLASGQVNRSQALDSSGTLPAISGKLVIKTEAGSAELFLSSARAKTNKEALAGFAQKINAANTGVTAAVVEKDGKSFLELTGEDSKGFSVSGSFAQGLGLDQVAAEKQDAVYTVAKNGGPAECFTSSTNNVTIQGAVTAKLKGVGKTVVSAGQSDTEKTANGMEKLIESFNSTLKYLNENSNQGVGVLNQIKRMVMSPTSERSMESIGITTAKDGSLSFDKAVFEGAMKSNPTLTKSIAANVAKGIQSDAQAGLKEPSQNLVAATGKSAAGTVSGSTSSYDMDTISFLSSYNRSGVFNTMNLYAVGALMNISV